jgi:hypothetical protein
MLGRSVALDGDNMLVGAYFANTTVEGGGKASLFTRLGSGWSHLADLIPNEPQALHHFGFRVAMEEALVVATVFDDNAAALVFERIANEWVETASLPVGGRVAVSNGRIASGAGSGVVAGGIVAIYEKQGGQWVEVQSLTPETKFDDQYGTAVDIDGDLIAVGNNVDDTLGNDSGSVWIHEWDGTRWSDGLELTASDGQGLDYLGNSVSVDGDRVLAGAVGANVDGDVDAGAAYLFERVDGAWVETAKFIAPDGAPESSFGESVCIEGDQVLIGAPRAHDASGTRSGAAYLFREVDGAWIFEQKIDRHLSAGSSFGMAVDLEDGAGVATASGWWSNQLTGNLVPGSVHPLPCLPEPLRTDAYALSLSAGGEVKLSLNAGSVPALNAYFVLASASGNQPGVQLGEWVLPLQVDDLFLATLNQPNIGTYVDNFGVLPMSGLGEARIVVPAGSFPDLAGITVHHAFCTIDLSPLSFGQFIGTSNSVELELLP